MRVQLLEQTGEVTAGSQPLRWTQLPDPLPTEDEVLIRVRACGVCHTELDEIERRTPPSRLPMVLGHQVVGEIESWGSRVSGWAAGDRVGVAWIYSACGRCSLCRAGQENLCPEFRGTGRDAFGGYAERMTAPASFVFRLPDELTDVQAAPLLCAGAVGYRALRLTGLQDGQALGLTGFGGSGHLVLKMVRHQLPNSKVFVFARNAREREFALELGAAWAGHTTEHAPLPLQAVIDTTPAWLPTVKALENLAPGGRLVINAIRKTDVDKEAWLQVDYAQHLWLEHEIKSVANVTRNDVREFLALAAAAGLAPQTRTFPLSEANQALIELKTHSVIGSKVLLTGDGA